VIPNKNIPWTGSRGRDVSRMYDFITFPEVPPSQNISLDDCRQHMSVKIVWTVPQAPGLNATDVLRVRLRVRTTPTSAYIFEFEISRRNITVIFHQHLPQNLNWQCAV